MHGSSMANPTVLARPSLFDASPLDKQRIDHAVVGHIKGEGPVGLAVRFI